MGEVQKGFNNIVREVTGDWDLSGGQKEAAKQAKRDERARQAAIDKQEATQEALLQQRRESESASQGANVILGKKAVGAKQSSKKKGLMSSSLGITKDKTGVQV